VLFGSEGKAVKRRGEYSHIFTKISVSPLSNVIRSISRTRSSSLIETYRLLTSFDERKKRIQKDDEGFKRLEMVGFSVQPVDVIQ
jgi:hypothetical protein